MKLLLFLLRIVSWWRNRHSMFITCDSEKSTIVLSKKLYEHMRKDHPNDVQFNVMFTKVGDRREYQYAMFFNPEWEKHGVSDPRMIMTIPVTVSNKGRVGFQTIQPTVKEISLYYGMTKSDEFRLNVSRNFINEEPYYIIEK